MLGSFERASIGEEHPSVQLVTSAVVGGGDGGAGSDITGSRNSLDECGASKDTAKKDDSKLQLVSPNVEGLKSTKAPTLSLTDSECKRVCSEIARLLMCHPEHAMTLDELRDSFLENEDPINPSLKDLQYCVTSYAQEKGTQKFSVKKVDKTLVLVSLTPTAAQWKLTVDLLFLFVYKPVPTFSLTLEDLLTVYRECYSRPLNPNIYNCPDVTKLLQVKTVAKSIKFDPETSQCVVKPSSRSMIFTQLASELLFKHGPNCSTLGMFVSEWRNYFGVPLSLSELGVESLEVLVSVPDVSPFIKVVDSAALSRLALTARGLYQEQLRHLLMVHEGRIPLDLLQMLFLSEFAQPTYPEITNWLKKKEVLPHASQVANLVGLQWMVWAPSGRPYPDTRLEKQQMVAPEGMEGNPDILLDTFSLPSEVEGSGLEADLFAPIEIDSDLIATLYSSEVDLPPMITLEDISPETAGMPPAESNTASSASHSSLGPMPAAVSGEEVEGDATTITSPEDIMKMMEAKRRRGDKIDMEPIIDLLGDLSTRELERVDGSVPKPKPSRSRSGRQKPSLAICFPGQSMPPSDADKSSSHDLSHPLPLEALVDDSLTGSNTTAFGMPPSADGSSSAKQSFPDLKDLDVEEEFVSKYLEPGSNKPDVFGAASGAHSAGGDYLTDEEKLQAKQNSDLPPGSPPSEWPELD